MNSLFVELRRRDPFLVGIAYLVLGWMVIQVIVIVTPAVADREQLPALDTWFEALVDAGRVKPSWPPLAS